MLARINAYLHRNRHDTFYFRRAVPAPLARFFVTKEIYRSLATRDRVDARRRALAVALQVEAVFEELRRMPKKKPAETMRTNLEVLLKADPDKGFEWIKLDVKKGEEELANRLGPAMVRAALEATARKPGSPSIRWQAID